MQAHTPGKSRRYSKLTPDSSRRNSKETGLLTSKSRSRSTEIRSGILFGAGAAAMRASLRVSATEVPIARQLAATSSATGPDALLSRMRLCSMA